MSSSAQRSLMLKRYSRVISTSLPREFSLSLPLICQDIMPPIWFIQQFYNQSKKRPFSISCLPSAIKPLSKDSEYIGVASIRENDNKNMIKLNQRQIRPHNKKPTTVIIIQKKTHLPLQKMLQSFRSSHHKSKSPVSAIKSRPIHQSIHLQTLRQPLSSRLSETYEWCSPQKQMQLRICRQNQFNRRNYEEHSSTKNSLYFKNLRKCKSNITKTDFQSALQTAITKKKITSKEDSMREGQLFWDNLMKKIEQEQILKPNNDETFRINTHKKKLRTQFNQAVYDRIRGSNISKVMNRKGGGLKRQKDRQLTEMDEHIEVQPWDHTKKIQGFPGCRGNSINSGIWPYEP